MIRKIVTLFLGIIAISGLNAQDYRKIPAKIKSGYRNYFFKGVLKKDMLPGLIKNQLAPMRNAGFNCIDLKLHIGRGNNFRKPETLKELKRVAETVNQYNLVLMTYLYPASRRDQKTQAEYPALVNERGKIVPDKFSMCHWKNWECICRQAIQLAEASKTIPVSAVKLDVELFNNMVLSYDDESWREYANWRKLPSDIPAEERFHFLKNKKLSNDYETFFINKVSACVKKLEKVMHKANPHLSLGVMPQTGNSKAIDTMMVRFFGTAAAPAIIDNWALYDGSSNIAKVKKMAQEAKKLNPYNRSVTWFRYNAYTPDNIDFLAYWATMNSDGYSGWELCMLNKNQQALSKGYRLRPGDKQDAYFAAFRRANEAICSGKPIKIKKIAPMAAILENLDKVVIPQAKPYGDGSGAPQWLSLRDQQTIYFYGQSGEDIKFEICHAAGSRRPMGLSYIIYDKNKNVLRKEEVVAGETAVFKITFPSDGIGSLIVSGGIGGAAWYKVKIYSRHIGISITPRLYCMNPRFKQIFYGLSQRGTIKFSTGRSQMFDIFVNKNLPVSIDQKHPYIFKFGRAGEPFSISYGAPKQKISGYYTQDLFIKGNTDKQILLSDGPQRLLIVE